MRHVIPYRNSCHASRKPPASGSGVQPYKYNGKELDKMHGLNTYGYGARQYYSVVPMWDRMDPLCEKYYGTSPYVYCMNNPVNAIDPDGCDTLNISYTNGLWVFDDPTIAKGNDVFNVTLILAFLLLALSSCTNATTNRTIEKSDDSTSQVIEVDDSTSRVMVSDESLSQDLTDLGFLFGFGERVSGKTINPGGFIHIEYDNALVANDTLIVVTKEDKVLPILAFNEIRKPFSETQLKDMMKKYKLLKSVEDSELENNVDGNYEIPYLFFVNECDSIQYMITSSEKKPYTYVFCEARFGNTADNDIARRVFMALPKMINVDKLVNNYPNCKYIWFIQTDNKPKVEFHEWSLLVKLNNSKIDRILLTIDYDAILSHIYISDYMDC